VKSSVKNVNDIASGNILKRSMQISFGKAQRKYFKTGECFASSMATNKNVFRWFEPKDSKDKKLDAEKQR